MNQKFMGLVKKFKVKSIALKIYKWIFIVISKLPVKKNFIIFESYLGKQYSCNPRAIYEYLQKHHPEFKMVWSVQKGYTDVFVEKKVPYLKRFSLKWLIAMARAEYWVFNTRLPLWIPKPKHTIYLQTWHGTPLKKLANDMEEVHMPGTNTEKYKRNFTNAAKRWDYLISPNQYSTEIFARAFKFEKTILETGYPRNDFLYTHNTKQIIDQLKKKLDIPVKKKVILYAPTWRDDQFYQVGKYKFDLALDLGKLKEQLKDDYVILLRMHYLIAENLDLSNFEGFAYDVSDYEDIRDLYLISDLLITDYSSVFFDYANLKRPIIFFVYDINSYRDKLRGFYFDIEKEAPGPLAYTTDEVLQQIQYFERNNFEVPHSFEMFYNKFCYLEDGEASKRVVESVFF